MSAFQNNPFERFFNSPSVAVTEAQQPEVSESSGAHKEAFEAGEYAVRMTFTDNSQHVKTRETAFPIRSSSPLSLKELEQQAISQVAFTGPHNMGMDVYIKTYPEGHPVTIEVMRSGEETPIHTFVQNFNGSGRPVSK